MSHHGGHGYPITKQMRVERRKRAEALQEEYHKKYPTIQAKLDALPVAGANKQRAKLEALLKAEQDKADSLKKVTEVKAEKLEKLKVKKEKANK